MRLFPHAAILTLALAALAFPAQAQQADDWDLREDAARKLTLATLEFEGAPALAVRCLDGDLSVLATRLPAALPGANTMEMIVGDRSPGLSWRPIGDGRTAWHAAPDIAARDLRRGGAVTLRAVGDDGRLRRFDLSAPPESANVGRVLQACGRAVSDPRDDLRRLDPRDITWVQRGQPQFPQAAAARGVKTGEAVMSCRVNGVGGLDDCRLESETPKDAGFGAAAFQAREGARLALADGSSPDGALIILTTRFQVE